MTWQPHQQKIGLKIYWTWPSHHTKTSFPSVSLSHQETSISLLSLSIIRKTEWNHNHRKLTNLTTWTKALSHSWKLWSMLCRATQEGRVIVDSSDKTWSTGEGNGKPLQYSCCGNPMNSMKWQKDRTLKDELLRLVGAQYAYTIGDWWRNISRKRMKRQSQSENNTQLWM